MTTEGEPTPRIEKPVTIDILQKVADAGYPGIVKEGIALMISEGGEPLYIPEEIGLESKALKAQARKFKVEADILEGLSDQSDNPRWKALFTPKVKELKARVRGRLEDAEMRDVFLEKFAKE